MTVVTYPVEPRPIIPMVFCIRTARPIINVQDRSLGNPIITVRLGEEAGVYANAANVYDCGFVSLIESSVKDFVRIQCPNPEETGKLIARTFGIEEAPQQNDLPVHLL